jgi:hypothetical protein
MTQCQIPGCSAQPFGARDGDLYCWEHGTTEYAAAARLRADLLPQLLRALHETPDGGKQVWLHGPQRSRSWARYELWNFLKNIRDAWPGDRKLFEMRWRAGELNEVLSEMITPDTESCVRSLIAKAPTSGVVDLD